MEKVTGGPPESPTRRAARIARVGARYGFGFVFGGRLSRRTWRRSLPAPTRPPPRSPSPRRGPLSSGSSATASSASSSPSMRGPRGVDRSPLRFATDGATGEVWLLDPTESFSLDPERLRGVAEVLAAVRRGDVDGIVRALPLAGGSIPRADADLRRELRETLGSLGGPLWREHSLAVIRARSLEALRRGGSKLHDEVAQAAHAVVAAEGFSGKETRPAVEAAEALVSHHRDPARGAGRAAPRLAQPDTFADYPRQVHALLDELKDGEVEVRFRHAGLDDLI